MRTFGAIVTFAGCFSFFLHSTETYEVGKRYLLSPPVCMDKLINCVYFDPSVCTIPVYKPWAFKNCARSCNLCSDSGGTGSGSNSIITTPGTFSGGCRLPYRIVPEGFTWKDSCKYNCTCVNGTTGKIECKQLCFDWNLPSYCRMEPPKIGMCCPKPSCPSNYTITYPPGYTEE